MLKKLLNWLKDLLPAREAYVPLYDPPQPGKEEPTPSASQVQPVAIEAPPRGPFIVYVDDNYHYMDEDSRHTAGEFDTWEKAVTLAKKIVDETVIVAINDGLAPEESYDYYVMFGEDPWIVTNGTEPHDACIAAWSYARERCHELHGAKEESND